MLSGRPRELRLVRQVQVDGEVIDAPPAPRGERFLSTETVGLVQGAMTDVVSDMPGATGSRIYKMLQELGYEGSVLGGKTGTSVSGIGRPRVRKKTASFVGFAPTVNPQFLVVCVLRKDRASKFYGGKFAAPAAARLLLTALKQFRKGG